MSKLVEEALAGQDVIIARNGVPTVRLTRFQDDVLRTPGIWKGMGWIADDFDEPDPDIIRLFEGVDDR